MLLSGERGKPENPGKNLSEQSRAPTNSIHIIMTAGPGIEPGTHFWKVSVLTTTPTRPSKRQNNFQRTYGVKLLTITIKLCEAVNNNY